MKFTNLTSWVVFFKPRMAPQAVSAKSWAEGGPKSGTELPEKESARLSGKTIRITAQLIQIEADVHCWSETWDRKLDDIFEVQEEVAMAVAEKTREQIGHFEIDDAHSKRFCMSFLSCIRSYLLWVFAPTRPIPLSKQLVPPIVPPWFAPNRLEVEHL